MGLRDYDLEQPACFLMSNGSYSILFSELGQKPLKMRGQVLTAFEKRRFSERQGVSFYALYGSEFISLAARP